MATSSSSGVVVNATTKTTGGTRTILRIKRRRTEEPLPYLRLEGLDGRRRPRRDDNNNTLMMNETTSFENQVNDFLDENDAAEFEEERPDSYQQQATPGSSSSVTNSSGFSGKRRKKSCAVWKRLSLEQDKQHSYRIVDAMLEGDGRISKRRKLTLLDTSQTTTTSSVADVAAHIAATMTANSGGMMGPFAKVTGRRKTTLRVLDPLSRMVDDSLQDVHAGSKSIQDHVQFVTMDSRMVQDTKKWLAWCHSSGGNILHACALWNDVEGASELLGQQLLTRSMIATLTEAVDGDGRTPYEVAQLSGHDSVCQVLEAFGGDTTNYVYDIFCLEDDNSEMGGEENRNLDDCGGEGTEEDERMTVELRGGVGYWTPEGELVLQAPTKSSSASLTHLFDEDGDIDSNCEEYGANDYPDEDEVVWGDDEEKEEDDPMMDENAYSMDVRAYQAAQNNGYHDDLGGHYSSSYNNNHDENLEPLDYDAAIRGVHF
jgi:Transcription factor Iwr1